jgi:glutathione S-transferase
MRVLSKKLGKYEGRNEKENELLDVCSDMILDWGFKWAIALFFGKDEDYAKHGKEELPKLYKSWNDILSDSPSGPYVLGDHISYVDFGLYHIIEDDQSADLLKGNKTEYPHLVKFIEAMNSRPNLSKYLATERK